jgi:hypothetical protein
MVRAGKGRALAWAAVAWVEVAPEAAVAELAAVEVEAGAEAPADPARAVAAARTCGNPAEAVVVRAAGDWELEAWGPARAVAARARVVVAEQEVAAVAEQEVVEEQEVPGLEGAAVALARARVVVAEQEVAVAAQEQEPAEAVQELVVGEVAVGQAEDRAEDPAAELAAELAKEPHLEDGRPHRRCCAEPLADWAAWQALLAHQQKAAAVVFRWPKRMFGRCWDCSRNWGSPAKIRMREWTRRLSNPA